LQLRSKFQRIKITINITVTANAIVKIDHLGLTVIARFKKIKITLFFFARKVDNTDCRTVDFITKTFGRINIIVV